MSDHTLLHSTGPVAPYQVVGTLTPGNTAARPLKGKPYHESTVPWNIPTPVVPCQHLMWGVTVDPAGMPSMAFSPNTLSKEDALCATAILNTLFYKAADHFAFSLEFTASRAVPHLNILCSCQADQATVNRLLAKYRALAPADVEEWALNVIGEARA